MEPTGHWLPVREVAQTLDLSERSIRRYLRAGVYRGRLVKGTTQVWLPAGAVLTATDNTGTNGPVLPDMPDMPHMPDVPGSDGDSLPGLPGITGSDGTHAVTELADLLREERERNASAQEVVLAAQREIIQAREAAAMWQERARNLEAENAKLQELLALPAHEEEPEPTRRWWQRWRLLKA